MSTGFFVKKDFTAIVARGLQRQFDQLCKANVDNGNSRDMWPKWLGQSSYLFPQVSHLTPGS